MRKMVTIIKRNNSATVSTYNGAEFLVKILVTEAQKGDVALLVNEVSSGGWNWGTIISIVTKRVASMYIHACTRMASIEQRKCSFTDSFDGAASCDSGTKTRIL